MRELKVEMNELKNNQRATSLHTYEESKGFIKRYMYCDSLEYEKKNYSNYD